MPKIYTTRNFSRKRSKNGFSLIEVIITIAIMLIMTGIVATTLLSRSPATSLQAQANYISASVQQARVAAIQNGKPVTIARSGDNFNVIQPGNTTIVKTLQSDVSFSTPDASVVLSATTLGTYAPSLVIQPSGAATTGDIYISSKASPQTSSRIRISAAGTPTVTKWNGSLYQ